MSSNERTWPSSAEPPTAAATHPSAHAIAARGRLRFGMLALITIVLALSSGDRAALSVAGTDMGRELGITTIQIGYLFSAFSWAYVLFMVPSGWLSDRVGSKKSMFWAVVIWSAFTVCMGLIEFAGLIFPLLLALRFMLGIAESPVGPASTRVIASWFPSSERGIAGAIFNSAQYLSLALFTPFMGWVCYAFGWQYVFIAMGITGFVIATIWIRYYHLPTRHPKLGEGELAYIRDGGGLVDLRSRNQISDDAPQRSQLAEIGLLFRSRMLIGMFLGQYCITAVTWFYVTWFPIYLVKQRGFDILQAGFVSSIPALCGLIGAIASGFVSDALLKRTGSLTFARKGPIVTGVLLSSSMILCNYIDAPWLVVAVMSVAFFGKGFGNLGFSVVADTAPKEIVGATGGVFNAIGNIAGIITPVIIGYLLHSSGSFNSALLYVGAHGLVAAFSYLFIVGKIRRLTLDELDRRQ
ncbi:MFS transporter [Burkholderia multivorans]|uniref:MFS transporter n=1 Tax=Burkholderia multivorans TaxID=87883 RepID=UPI001C22B41C|nr:MFS transporter [Burkholderia multivorans]MBU9363454.1 MFS transporter [Burkholderia multivorans]